MAMRRVIWITIAVILIFPTITVSKGFVPSYTFSFSTSKDTYYFISGELHLHGKLIGKEIEKDILPVNLSALKRGLDQDVSSVIDQLINSDISVLSLISSEMILSGMKEIYIFNLENRTVKRFENITLDIDNASIMVIGSNEELSFKKKVDYGIASFGEIEIMNDKANSLFIISEDNLSLGIENSPSFVILPTSSTEEKECYAHIIDNAGNVLWESSENNWAILASDNSLDILSLSQPHVILFDETEDFYLELSSSNKLPDAERFFSSLEEMASSMGGEFPQIDQVSMFASPIVDVLNGACVLFNSNDSIVIEGDEKKISDLCLIRVENAMFWLGKGDEGAIFLNGEGKARLLFLGNSVYNEIPVSRLGGFLVPIQPIALWAIAIAIFIIFRLVLRGEEEKKVFGRFPIDVDQKKREMIKKIFFVVHILLAILTLFIFDMFLGETFGLSFIPYLSKNMLASGIIISAEIVLISTCFVMFGLPVRIITNTLLNFIGLGKESKNVGKSLALLVMWLLSPAYLLFFSNALIGLIKNILAGMVP